MFEYSTAVFKEGAAAYTRECMGMEQRENRGNGAKLAVIPRG